ncbi:GNAT family N-acetyltransferase [Streptomyces sp. NPDC055189]
MLELAADQIPPVSRWFAAGSAGAAVLPEHVLATGAGRWWADRALEPRALGVSCGNQLLLRGDPSALTPAALIAFPRHHVQAPTRFLPLLGAAFDLVVPWEQMVYVHQEPPATARRTPRGVVVRALTAEDTEALTDALASDSAWIYATWESPAALTASGRAVGAFHKDRLLSVACTYLRGSVHEDIAVATVPQHRGRGLALACVTALCRDIAARGATPSWTCSRDNRPSRLLAWTAGFRLTREYVHYLTGQPSRRNAGLTA